MSTFASLARRRRTQAVVVAAAFLLTALLLCAKVAFGSGLKGFDAAGPNKDYPEKMMLYGRFVGDWKVDYTAYAPDGSKQLTATGEWHFGWALDGRAIADVFIMPGEAERVKPGAPKGEWGGTLGYYDPKIDAWHIVFVGPAYHNLNVFVARLQGDEIVQEGKSQTGKPSRWIFSKITADSFHWRALISDDEGKTWQLREEMSAHRVK